MRHNLESFYLPFSAAIDPAHQAAKDLYNADRQLLSYPLGKVCDGNVYTVSPSLHLYSCIIVTDISNNIIL